MSDVLNRFWSKVLVREADACWLWQASTSGSGFQYGQFGVRRGQMVKAHRFAWELANRLPVPEGCVVMHRCDTPLCCNPRHLFLGSQADNLIDARQKGRLNLSRERTRKLTPGQRAEIRRRVAAGERPIALAFEYGVSRVAVSHIVNGRMPAPRRKAA